ncbi:MAG: trypsin-like peptidase domain-containing protein [Cytophagaceae bacterium]|nr:trypsin-like peptidase domain-containing protein [Cytophagaceae bacterium]MDW8456808.1 trypsin-like peptidase domain-containing protein [Cytophagaceae bacterium]
MNSKITIVVTSLMCGFAGAYVHGLLFPSSKTYYVSTTDKTHMDLVNLTKHLDNKTSQDFVLASSIATSSVVYITTISQTEYDPFNWFDFYFGGSQQVQGSGSGVIYSPDGYIITNNHVIDKSEKIEVVHEKRTYKAKVVGRDPSTDLAILKIDAQNLPAIPLGSSKDLKIGEWVLAVGNPFNLTSTVTAGIVSAKGRHINVVNSRFPIESFIQTDAAINPGNSGGALVNIKGELVGINTAILSKTGSYSGYGFAVPVDIVKKIAKDIIKYGEVQKAFFGAEVSDLNASYQEKYKLDDLNGVIITYLQKDGAADNIGLSQGDIILKINDQTITSKSMFDEYISYFSPGDKIKVLYKRDNKIQEAVLTLTNREGTTDILKRELYTSESLGADFEAVSKVEKDKLKISNGVRIVNVRSGLIRRLGLSEGFIITSINRVPVSKPEEVVDILEKIKGRVTIEGITNNGQRGYYSYYF